MEHIDLSYFTDNYREIADKCIETGKPIILTENGLDELVVMSKESYEQRCLDIKIQMAILESERCEFAGETNYLTLEESKKKVLKALKAMFPDFQDKL